MLPEASTSTALKESPEAPTPLAKTRLPSVSNLTTVAADLPEPSPSEEAFPSAEEQRPAATTPPGQT